MFYEKYAHVIVQSSYDQMILIYYIYIYSYPTTKQCNYRILHLQFTVSYGFPKRLWWWYQRNQFVHKPQVQKAIYGVFRLRSPGPLGLLGTDPVLRCGTCFHQLNALRAMPTSFWTGGVPTHHYGCDSLDPNENKINSKSDNDLSIGQHRCQKPTISRSLCYKSHEFSTSVLLCPTKVVPFARYASRCRNSSWLVRSSQHL